MDKAALTHVEALFTKFGCTTKETKLYLQCLKMGPSSVQEIAKSLRQNRVTIHSAVQQLMDKGFLYETRSGKRRLIVAENPTVLRNLYQKQENELKVVKQNLGYVEGLLEHIQNQDRSVPSVKIYEGVDGFKKMLEESLETKSEIVVCTYVDLFSNLLDPDYLEDYFARRAAKGIYTRLVFPPCDFAYRVHAKSKQYKIQVRFLPSDLKWASGIFVWDDKISIKSFTEGKLNCTIIQNEDIAYFFRDIIFEILWKISASKS